MPSIRRTWGGTATSMHPLDSAGLTPDELAEAAAWRLREDETIPLRPIAAGWQEGGPGDFKACLTEPLEEPKEGEPEPLPR